MEPDDYLPPNPVPTPHSPPLVASSLEVRVGGGGGVLTSEKGIPTAVQHPERCDCREHI